jgi:hypothetical protein
MAMTMDYGLLGEDGSAQSKKNLKVVGCVVCALTMGVTLGAMINGYSNSNSISAASEMAAIGALPVSRARLGARSTLMRDPAFSSPLANLAMTSLDINSRMNRGARDMSMKVASQELGEALDLVPAGTQQTLIKQLEPMKYPKNFLAGITKPLGYFDPLSCSAGVSAGKLLFYREVELKHGRVSMLAALGILVGETYHPLFGGNIDTPAAFAFQETPLETFWPVVVAAIAIPEIYSVFTFQEPESGPRGGFSVQGEQWTVKEDHIPGDVGFDPLGLKPTDEKEFLDLHTKELNNGRLAMIATAGFIAQELVSGQKIFG